MSPNADSVARLELFQGTLDLLILRTLRWGAMHGYAIAKFIEQTSGDEFRIDHGSLYPALQRLQQEGWIRGEWGTTNTGRKAKFYKLTASGRRQLLAEESRWLRFTSAIAGILGSTRPVREEE
jgi:transcriptional regulator